ncbi:hypothetical protein [Rhizobium phage RHph_X66]|nr:hypothetical protein [Rhizobium phage RHph_X66]
MDRAEFKGQLEGLRTRVLSAVASHFDERNLVFDVVRFMDQTEVDLDQFLREAYFLGAEVFPIDPL